MKKSKFIKVPNIFFASVDLKMKFRELLNMDVPIDTQLKIFRISKKMREEGETLDECRKNLFKKYQEKTEAGEPVTLENGTPKVDPEKEKEFVKDMEELYEGETELKGFSKITIAEIIGKRDREKFTGKASIFTSLEWLFDLGD